MRTLFALVLALGIGGTAAFAQTTTTTAKSAAMPSCAASDPVVWVNTSSNVYHMKGSKYYGNTKAGKYMCQSAANSAGAHQAKNETSTGKSTMSKSSSSTPAPGASGTPKPSWWHHATPKPSPAST
jgi:hypothetical protein